MSASVYTSIYFGPGERQADRARRDLWRSFPKVQCPVCRLLSVPRPALAAGVLHWPTWGATGNLHHQHRCPQQVRERSHPSTVGGKDESVWFQSCVFLQSSQEKWQHKAGWLAEAVGLVPGSGTGDVSAVEGGHRAVGQNGPRRAERWMRFTLWLSDWLMNRMWVCPPLSSELTPRLLFQTGVFCWAGGTCSPSANVWRRRAGCAASPPPTPPVSSVPVWSRWSRRVPLSSCQVKGRLERGAVVSLWEFLSWLPVLLHLVRFRVNGFSVRSQHHSQHANVAVEHASGHVLHTHLGVPHFSHGAGQHQHFRAHRHQLQPHKSGYVSKADTRGARILGGVTEKQTPPFVYRWIWWNGHLWPLRQWHGWSGPH